MNLLITKSTQSRSASGIPGHLLRTGCRGAALLFLTLLLLCPLILGCSGGENQKRYDAEKSLFTARKMRDDLFRGTIKEPFLERAIQNYRAIVNEYSGSMKDIEGLGEIVVLAQMELAELEFKTGMLGEALADFDMAIDMADDIPPARANALYSCGVISEELRNTEGTIIYYERFADDYLADSRLLVTARLNMRYLVTPLKLFGLHRSIGNEEKAASWLGRAEEIYSFIIENEQNEGMRKEVRFNLLTVYLQGKQWKRTIEYIDELERMYGEDPNRPSLAFIRAMVEKEGFGNTAEAYDLYMSVYNEYPKSVEAPRALLAAADIRYSEKRYPEAKEIYKKVIDEYSGSVPEVVQAEWQSARLLEESGKWGDASLKYKEIYQNYPNTEQGLQAPLMLIRNYREKDEEEAARAAYDQAVEHYGQLISSQGSAVAVKIMAESHLVTAHADMERWEEAAGLLLLLPEKYPGYPRFIENYLMAASIYEKELKDSKRATEALRICMERYPGSPVAVEAEKQYRRIEEQK